ncbi:hypothetical protein JCM30237_15170 [Halolamina litorea]|uniref:Chloride channel protein n=1 Tax=Halolamina litorea TaxID=1515593 RepID=A0ABD6BMD8_9EURY|nr:hypothetical protein [Halolamina litorea]
MSRSDERDRVGAWDDGMPSFRERLKLAIRQSPVRGVVVLLLLLLGLSFLVAGIVAFRDAIWAAVVDAASGLLAGEPLAILGAAVVLVAVGVPILLLRRG